jgi:hypothetical protein
MVRKDFIPHADSPFNDWQNNFVTRANVYMPSWGLTTAALTEWTLLTNTPGKKKRLWDQAWPTIASRLFDRGDTALKKRARKEYEFGFKDEANDTSLRMYISRYLRNNPLVTTEQRVDLGLRIPDLIRTPSPGADGAGQNMNVEGAIAGMKHFMHRSCVMIPGALHKGLDVGVDAIEVYLVIKEASVKEPPDVKEYTMDGEVKRGYYIREFDFEHEGMRAWYLARIRFKGRKKTFGPYSYPWSGLIW